MKKSQWMSVDEILSEYGVSLIAVKELGEGECAAVIHRMFNTIIIRGITHTGYEDQW